jgi:hypothetical protein
MMRLTDCGQGAANAEIDRQTCALAMLGGITAAILI